MSFVVFPNHQPQRQPASYGKKNGMWYASPNNHGWGGGGGSKGPSRKSSIIEADISSGTSGSVKPSAGRVIRIINNADHAVQVSDPAILLKQLNGFVRLLLPPPIKFYLRSASPTNPLTTMYIFTAVSRPIESTHVTAVRGSD